MRYFELGVIKKEKKNGSFDRGRGELKIKIHILYLASKGKNANVLEHPEIPIF